MKSLCHITSLVLRSLYKLTLVFLCVSMFVYLGFNAASKNYENTLALSPGQFMDCRVFKSFAGLALSPEKSHLYNYDVQQKFFAEKNPGALQASYVPYPPTFALLWSPMLGLSDSSCMFVWTSLSILIFISGILLAGGAFKQRTSHALWIIVATLASIPAWRCVALGQTSLMFTGFLAIFIAAWKIEKPAFSALGINLLALKPPLAVLPAFLLLAKKSRSAILYSVVFFFMLVLLCAFLFSWEALLSYPAALINAMKIPPQSFHVDDMVNLRGLLTPLPFAAFVSTCAFLLSVLALLFLILRLEIADEDLICFLVFCTLALSTHVHLYECTSLAIPALILLGQGESRLQSAGALKGASRFLQSASKWLLSSYPAISWILYKFFYEGSGKIFFSAFALMNLFMCLSALFILFSRSTQPVAAQDSPES